MAGIPHNLSLLLRLFIVGSSSTCCAGFSQAASQYLFSDLLLLIVHFRVSLLLNTAIGGTSHSMYLKDKKNVCNHCDIHHWFLQGNLVC